jgi:hypothetical protein
MTCERCHGLMVGERMCDLQGTSDDLCVDGYRCLLCGNVVDTMILQIDGVHPRRSNRLRSSALGCQESWRREWRRPPKRRSDEPARVITDKGGSHANP